MSIRWDEFEPRRYEDMVSVLLSRLHPDAQRIDGSGGDGGRDVQIVSHQEDQIVDAFELKSFTGRMTPARRKQAARSLSRAAALGPTQWTLVVPIDPTPSEERWFHQLRQAYSFPIRWFGKTWLDEKVSAFPDIRRYFIEGASEEVVRLLRELQSEHAIVTDVSDAVVRVRRLRERLSEIDPHYRYELSTGAGATNYWPTDVVMAVGFADVRVDVYPKYEGAVKDRPITINVAVVVGPENEVVQNALDYGLDVKIPPHLVGSIMVNAPSGLGGNFSGGEISLFSTNEGLRETITVALEVMDDGKLLASCPVHLNKQTMGLKGSIISGTDSSGWLKTRITMNFTTGEFTITFRLDPKPILPSSLVPLCRWLVAMHSPHDLVIRWPGIPEMRSPIPALSLVDERFGQVVGALAYLQDTSGIYREMGPSSFLEGGEEVVRAASLLKGEIIDLTWESISVSLSGWGSELDGLLRGIPQQFVMEQDCWLELEEVTIPIGRVRTHFPSARLADPEVTQRDLSFGLVPELRLVPGDGDKAQSVLVPQTRM